MIRFLPLAMLTTMAAATMASAQQTVQKAEDHALRFNGKTDFVAVKQTSGAVNSFTIDFWANPTATHDIDPESFAGYDGINGQQRYALYPSHGTHCWGWGHAGAGISVGTNGVSVYEHAGDYIPAVLVHEQAISGWTHITLVYRDRVPSLYIDGRLVRTGRQSPQKYVHPSTGDDHIKRMVGGFGGGPYGYYQGDLDNVRVWSQGFDDATVASLKSSRALDNGSLILALDMNRSGAGDGLIVPNGSEATLSAVLTHGTASTPVFTLREAQADTRIQTVEVSREELSTPLEHVDVQKSEPSVKRQRPTIE